MRSAFANNEETSSYSFEEFPKADTEVSEYTGAEGIQEYQLKGFDPNAPAYSPAAELTPVVKPAIFQDFKQVIPQQP